MHSTRPLWQLEERVRNHLKLVSNTILAIMRPGCLILTATILRSSIKASRRQNIVHRERSRKELGPKFDSRTFHDEMLNGENLPWISLKPAPISGSRNNDRGDGELLGRVWLDRKGRSLRE